VQTRASQLVTFITRSCLTVSPVRAHFQLFIAILPLIYSILRLVPSIRRRGACWQLQSGVGDQTPRESKHLNSLKRRLNCFKGLHSTKVFNL
jgi:hypothetical protein